MKTNRAIIIGIIVFLLFVSAFVVLISYMNYLEERDESLYEKCLNKCGFFRAENTLRCIEGCNAVFKEVMLDFFDKFESVLNNLIEDEK